MQRPRLGHNDVVDQGRDTMVRVAGEEYTTLPLESVILQRY